MNNRQKLIEELEAGYECEVGKLKMISVDKAVEIVRSQPPADQWIPCSSGKMPEHEADVLVTLESLFKRRYVINARYFAEMGVVYEDEWTGEGFYTYDSEYGWGKHENVIAWMPAEPYKEVE